MDQECGFVNGNRCDADGTLFIYISSFLSELEIDEFVGFAKEIQIY